MSGGTGHGHHGHHHRIHGGGFFFGPDLYDPYVFDDDYDDAYVYDTADADQVRRCQERYRSFDESTGTFLSNDGHRYLCPYLR